MGTMDDLIGFCQRAAEAIDIPIIADADDGGGNPLNVYRTVQRYERAGAACVMIEDLYGAKHLTGYSEGKILGAEAMIDKIHAATDARRERGPGAHDPLRHPGRGRRARRGAGAGGALRAGGRRRHLRAVHSGGPVPAGGRAGGAGRCWGPCRRSPTPATTG